MKEYNRLQIQDILRAQDVKRWTIVNATRQQSLAEHTFNVIAIARSIAANMGIADEKIIKYAFDHDLDEILTGDVPTPAKDRMDYVVDDYAGKSSDNCTPLDKSVVMIADTIEAVWFINTNGMGRHAVDVCNYLIDKLNSRIALHASTHKRLEEAVGKVIRDINEGEFTV